MPFTYFDVLKRALIAGLLAGVLSGGYVLLIMEPVITDAIALEDQLAAAAPTVVADDSGAPAPEEDHSHGDSLISRRGQLVGGFVASVVLGLIASLVFATVFSGLRHRLPGWTDFQRSLWMAGAGFVAISLLPALKYPANPPAVGDPDTVGQRSLQWIAIVVASLILVVALTHLSGVLRTRLDGASRTIVVAVTTIIAFAALLVVMPATPDSISPDIPAALVWDFRIRSIGGLALLWSMIGVGFGWLLTRDTNDHVLDSAARQPQSV